MIQYFKNLLTDETVFIGLVRAVGGALAVAPIEAMPPELRPVLLAAALFFRSSSK